MTTLTSPPASSSRRLAVCRLSISASSAFAAGTGRAAAGTRCKGPSSRTSSTTVVDQLGPLRALGRRHPGEAASVRRRCPGNRAGARNTIQRRRAWKLPRGVVAVVGMAAGDDDAVAPWRRPCSSSMKSIRPVQGRRMIRDVRGVLDPARAGQVGAGVGAPVADEGDDLRFELGHRSSPPLSRAITSANTCSLVKPCRSIDFDRQRATQVPQPWQRPGLTLATVLITLAVAAVDLLPLDRLVGAGRLAEEAADAGRKERRRAAVDHRDDRLARQLVLARRGRRPWPRRPRPGPPSPGCPSAPGRRRPGRCRRCSSPPAAASGAPRRRSGTAS